MSLLTIFVSIWLISLWVYVRRGKSAKRALVIGAGFQILIVALIWGGPIASGALFLLLPARAHSASADLPLSYRPMHRGHIDLATGLYIREDDDLVLAEPPSFVWRRAYLSRDRVARQMGIGTTHNGDWYLYGDLKKVELILEDGARVAFDRTSRGSSYYNAMFEHTSTPTEFYGARLGWTGRSWAIRYAGGELAIFRACDTPGIPCALISTRDRRGRVVRFNRDGRGILRTIDAGPQRAAFEYDDRNRIVRAVHGSQEAAYSYDDGGRLVRATAGGVTRSFRYGSRDEMIAIEEPNRTIENTYDDNLRVISQVVRRTGHAEQAYSFAYAVHGGAVTETTVTNPNGSRTTYRWNQKRRQELEIHEGEGDSVVMVQYARSDGVFTGELTISCTNAGRPVTETVEVFPGDESRVKAEVIERICAE